MNRRLVAALGLLCAGSAALLFSECFAPTYSDCAFKCGTSEPLCPDEYECRSDQYCHLKDSAPTKTCGAPSLPVSFDLGLDAAPGG